MKLLIFNEDWADEHNVPALEVMTDEEYEIWCKKPSGTLNPNYEEEKQAYEEREQKNKDFWNLLLNKGYIIDGSANINAIPENDLETLLIVREYRKLRFKAFPDKVKSNLYAYLGNSGGGFEESFNNFYLFEEFVKANIVEVTEITEEFYNTFKAAKLSSLSLCNIFTL